MLQLITNIYLKDATRLEGVVQLMSNYISICLTITLFHLQGSNITRGVNKEDTCHQQSIRLINNSISEITQRSWDMEKVGQNFGMEECNFTELELIFSSSCVPRKQIQVM